MKKYIFLVPLLLILSVSLYFRLFPAYFPQLKTQARNLIEQEINQAVMREVYRKFPQYDPLAKDKLIKTNLAEYKRQHKDEIGKQTHELYLKLKDRFQDESGRTYMMELDCWHWARYVENLVNLGHPGDKVIDGKQFDELMLAPQGYYLNWESFLFYFSAFLYKVFSLFKSVPLFTFLFYLPLLFTAILIVVLWFFSFKQGGYIGAIISCTIVGLYANFIPRSCVGWFDKDVLNIIFPILIIWLYILSQAACSFRRRLFWVCASSFFVGLFCFTWAAWWFVFMIVVIYEAIYLALILLRRWLYNKYNAGLFKAHLLSLSMFLIASLFWVIVFCGFMPLGIFYNEVKAAVTLSKAVSQSVWPNVYSTVGELKRSDLKEIVSSTGGLFIFIPAVFGMFFLLIRNLFFRRDNVFKRESAILLALWFAGMFYACFQGVRFTVFLLIPLSIFLGWFVNDIYGYLKKKGMKWPAIFIVLTISISLGISSVDMANKVSRSIFTLMNDTWYKFLNLMKENTPKDTIVNSWWDFGDWFKVVARRRVIFDGQTQNIPQAYWMAKAILAEKENESMAILRMLNNGGNSAFEIINGYLKDPLESVLLLESILTLDSGKAREILKDFLPASAADRVLILLFDQPANACFVVDNSMVNKIGAISFLGNWNFAKVYIAQNFNIQEKDRIIERLVNLGKDREEMERIYQEAFLIPAKERENWISRPLQFFSGLVRGTEREGVVFFDNGFFFNIKENTVYTNSGQIPRSLFFCREGGLVEVKYPSANVIFSILLIKTTNGYLSVLLPPELANSLFVRLYFLRGFGLKHFQAVIDSQEGADYIGVYRINW